MKLLRRFEECLTLIRRAKSDFLLRWWRGAWIVFGQVKSIMRKLTSVSGEKL